MVTIFTVVYLQYFSSQLLKRVKRIDVYNITGSPLSNGWTVFSSFFSQEIREELMFTPVPKSHWVKFR
jgi:hypothetical protein